MNKNKKNGLLLSLVFPIIILIIIWKIIWENISYKFIIIGCSYYQCAPQPTWIYTLSYTLRVIFFISIPISIYGLFLLLKKKK